MQPGKLAITSHGICRRGALLGSKAGSEASGASTPLFETRILETVRFEDHQREPNPQVLNGLLICVHLCLKTIAPPKRVSLACAGEIANTVNTITAVRAYIIDKFHSMVASTAVLTSGKSSPSWLERSDLERFRFYRNAETL